MNEWLVKVHNELNKGLAQNIVVDDDDWDRWLDGPFFYLGGRMTDVPHLNFPRFQEVGRKLRAQGYNMVLPIELDHPAAKAYAEQSLDGKQQDEYYEFLARDLCVVATPQCIGGIFLENWWESNGARKESFVLEGLGKPLYEYEEHNGTLALKRVNRSDRVRI